jgi:hypothetical protein
MAFRQIIQRFAGETLHGYLCPASQGYNFVNNRRRFNCVGQHHFVNMTTPRPKTLARGVAAIENFSHKD